MAFLFKKETLKIKKTVIFNVKQRLCNKNVSQSQPNKLSMRKVLRSISTKGKKNHAFNFHVDFIKKMRSSNH